MLTQHLPQTTAAPLPKINTTNLNPNSSIEDVNHSIDISKVIDVDIMKVRWRIELKAASDSLKNVRGALLKFFTHKNNQRHRDLIVKLAPPSFTPKSFGTSPSQHTQDKLGLDAAQLRALEKVRSADDYVLIMGRPGTGKTTTSATIITTLVRSNKTVLVVAYTHSAVDNLCEKILEKNVEVLRLTPKVKFIDSPFNFVERLGLCSSLRKIRGTRSRKLFIDVGIHRIFITEESMGDNLWDGNDPHTFA
jgi:hypothetical protein